MLEAMKSSLLVIKAIITGKINPVFIKYKYASTTNTAALANSITYTPGTASVYATEDYIIVHSLFGKDDSGIKAIETKLKPSN